MSRFKKQQIVDSQGIESSNKLQRIKMAHVHSYRVTYRKNLYIGSNVMTVVSFPRLINIEWTKNNF